MSIDDCDHMSCYEVIILPVIPNSSDQGERSLSSHIQLGKFLTFSLLVAFSVISGLAFCSIGKYILVQLNEFTIY